MHEFDLSDPDQRNQAAAEYVLGTLGRAEKARFESLLAVSPDAQQEVEQWREHLDVLNRSLSPVDPPPRVWQNIRREISGKRRFSLFSWQPLAALSLVLAITLGLFLESGVSRQDLYVYVVKNEQQQPGWMINTNFSDEEMIFQSLRPMDMPANRVYEAWLMAPDIEPIRLGFLPQDGEKRIRLKKEWMPDLDECQVVITVESPEGAPSGRQMGPVSDKAQWQRMQL